MSRKIDVNKLSAEGVYALLDAYDSELDILSSDEDEGNEKSADQIEDAGNHVSLLRRTLGIDYYE